jgi:hypothetical protein
MGNDNIKIVTENLIIYKLSWKNFIVSLNSMLYFN